jgi:urease subunit beta
VTVPGEFIFGYGPVVLNPGRPVLTLHVENTGDRPIQVGSHLHFAETNAALAFDRELAWGHRLGVPAGTSVRFEPGIGQDVELVPLAGARIVHGIRGLVGGRLDRVSDERPDA